MRSLGSSGIWELFVPAVEPGAHYKFEIRGADGELHLKADPFAFRAEVPPLTASIVHRPGHAWADGAWLTERRASDLSGPADLRSTRCTSARRRSPLEGDRVLTYLELADELAAYVTDLAYCTSSCCP